MSEQVQSKSQLLYAAGVAIHGKQIKDLRARLAAIEAERDRLREACERAKEHISGGSPTNDTGATLDHLRAALAAPAANATNTGREPGE